MERKIINELVAWKSKRNRKPIVNGARQVGKTYILQEFGAKYYSHFVYFNLETNTRVRESFDDDLSPERLIPMLEISAKSKIKHALRNHFKRDRRQHLSRFFNRKLCSPMFCSK